jgi:hypothetical protein
MAQEDEEQRAEPDKEQDAHLPPHRRAPRDHVRRRLGLLVVAGLAVAVASTLLPHWPKDNVVHVVLGAAAPLVKDVRLRFAPTSGVGADGAKAHPGTFLGAEDWTREVEFRFAEGSAPRVLTHEVRVADGDYVVEIEILKTAPPITTLQRRVRLEGGTTTIDVSDAVLR